MFEPRKLIPFSIEFCRAPIAVITEMTEKTPMVIPIMVRPDRNLFTPNEPNAIVMISLNRMIKIRISKSENRNKFEMLNSNSSFSFAYDCSENFHQLSCLCYQAIAVGYGVSLDI